MKRERMLIRFFVIVAGADAAHQAALEKWLNPLWAHMVNEAKSWQISAPGVINRREE